jgi:2-iminoacetate synthase ThiH
MSLDELVRLIRSAKKIPAERDSFYNVLRTFEENEPTVATSVEAA